MPSTYSTNLRFELIALGEQSGTWGTTTNTNLGTLIEQAIVGYGAVNFGSDANTTISISDGASSAARCFVLNVTSSGSLTATRNLTVPTISKPYLIFNNTTGGQSIQVKTASGTGITVANGNKRFVYADGTNVVESINEFGALTTGAITSSGAGSFSSLTTSGATINGTMTVSQQVVISGAISPTQITSNQNDYNPSGLSTATVLRLDTDASRNITGLSGGASGRVIKIFYVGSNSVTLQSQNASSSAANRFALATDVVLAAGNSADLWYDGTSSRWRILALYANGTPIGSGMDYFGSSAPQGYIFPYGQAISRTTYAALFAILSTTYGSGDGSTTFNVPDLRGRVPIAKDNMGGSAANRVTTAGSSIDGTTLGAVGGAQNVTLTTTEMPSHSHSVTDPTHTHSYQYVVDAGGSALGGGGQLGNGQAIGSTGAAATGISIQNAGSGGAHQNMPPGIVCNYILFAGV